MYFINRIALFLTKKVTEYYLIFNEALNKKI